MKNKLSMNEFHCNVFILMQIQKSLNCEMIHASLWEQLSRSPAQKMELHWISPNGPLQLGLVEFSQVSRNFTISERGTQFLRDVAQNLGASDPNEFSAIDQWLTENAKESRLLGADVGESMIQPAILQLMKDRRIWSNQELKSKLKRVLPLSEHDRGRAKDRECEAHWENKVNCALSRSRSASLYAKGHVCNVGRGLHQITDRGFDYITEI